MSSVVYVVFALLVIPCKTLYWNAYWQGKTKTNLRMKV